MRIGIFLGDGGIDELVAAARTAEADGLDSFWLPQIFGAIIPVWWRENILCYLPSNGIDSLTAGHIEDSPAFPDPTLGAFIAAAWLFGMLAFAYVSFLRRDA